MKKTLLTTLLLIAGLVAGHTSISYSRDMDEQVTKSFQVNQGQWLRLKSDLGSVEVNSWDRDEVKVTVVKTADTNSKKRAAELFNELELTFDQDLEGVKIQAEYHGPRNWWGEHRLRVHFDISVPRKFNLDLRTAGGSIGVADLIGKVELYTSGGSIKVGQIDGSVLAKTSGGGIKIQKARGDVTASTSGGGITVGEVYGSVTARTSGGGITLEGVVGDAEAHTSGGSLNLKNISGNVNGTTSGGSISSEITGKIDRNCLLKTSGGNIRLYLPEDISVDVDASTSGGSVSTDFPITVQGVIKSSSLQGKINQGGPLVTLRTSGGSIYINKLSSSKE